MFRQLLRVPSTATRPVLARSVNYAVAHADRAPKDYYKFLVEKTQDGKLLSKHDLRHVVLKCREAKDFQYAMKTVALYQRSNFDFNEEICSHMVYIAVEKNKAKQLVAMLGEPHHRLGNWLSRKSLSALADKLLEAQDFESLNSLFSVVKAKFIAHIVDPVLVTKLKEEVAKAEGNEKAAALGQTLLSL
eukprot:gene45352-55489_t